MMAENFNNNFHYRLKHFLQFELKRIFQIYDISIILPKRVVSRRGRLFTLLITAPEYEKHNMQKKILQ